MAGRPVMMMLKRFAATLLLTAPLARAAEFPVADAAAFDEAVKQAAAGDTLVMQAGEWKDADLCFRGHGENGRPITLRAAESGRVRLTGKSRLRLAGEHLVVEGLWFQNCLPEKSDIITFREDSMKLAHRCILRDCAITQDVASQDSTERKWVSLYGSGHRVERCHFEGKTSKGTLLVVWLPEMAGAPVKHVIAHNLFGPRPRLGKNGGEILRLGDSESSMQRAECLVEANWFEKCDGEVECISNKSCGNTYRSNTFIECQGTLTLRHGNGCLVEGNVFLGNHRTQTGGIRVIGEDHIVRGNHLEALEGDEARAALCLMNALVDSPLNGYWQVKRARIEGNTVFDCRQSLNIGYADKDVKASLPPVECLIAGNTLVAEGRKVVELVETTAQITWKDNTLWGADAGIPEGEGRTWRKPASLRPAAAALQRAQVGTRWTVLAQP